MGFGFGSSSGGLDVCVFEQVGLLFVGMGETGAYDIAITGGRQWVYVTTSDSARLSQLSQQEVSVRSVIKPL